MSKVSGIACSAAAISLSIAALGAGAASASDAASRPHGEHLGATHASLSLPSSRTAPRVRATAAKGLANRVTTTNRGAVALRSSLPLSGFGDVVADAAHGHVFVSGGDGTDGVTVADADGTIEQTLTSLPGASGMTLSADGSKLYVALANGDGIGTIDTATLAVTTVSTGVATCPRTVAVTAGTLWFGYGCDTQTESLGSVESNGTVHLGLLSGKYELLLATSPGADGVLMTGEAGLSPGTITEYTVTGGSTPSATPAHSRGLVDNGANIQDLAMTPDGQDVVVASGAPYYHQVYKTSDLSADGTYTTSNYPNAVAINEDGLVAAGIDGSPTVWLFQPGTSTASRTWSLQYGLVAGGLSFAGPNIYAVTTDSNGAYFLDTLSTLPNASITVSTDRTKYRYGGKVHVTVKVPGAPSGSEVGVYATPYGGSPILLKAGHPVSGTYTATVQVGYRTTFYAVYYGDSTHGPTESNAVTVKVHAYLVSKLFGKYATQHHVALYHVRKNPTIGAAVSPDHSGQCLYFVAQKPRGTGWHTVGKTGCVGMQAVQGGSSAAAIFGGTHRVGERVRLRAEWHGDRYNLAQYGRWLTLRFTR